jgi:hypothetical protein
MIKTTNKCSTKSCYITGDASFEGFSYDGSFADKNGAIFEFVLWWCSRHSKEGELFAKEYAILQETERMYKALWPFKTSTLIDHSKCDHPVAIIDTSKNKPLQISVPGYTITVEQS